MSSFCLLLLSLLSHVIHCQINSTNTTSTPITTTNANPTEYFTTSTPICSSNYAFVYIESSLSTISETVLSERVNFAPYSYDTILDNKNIVIFANGATMTNTVNNPCDITTWTESPSFYNDSIVIILYSSTYDNECTPQKWTINLQQYTSNTVHAVLIANDDSLTSVYTLNGDTNLITPSIPTRMIDKQTYDDIATIINTEQVYASINCFNDTSHPPTICVLDSSIIFNPYTAAMDGEFQEQGIVFCYMVLLCNFL